MHQKMPVTATHHTFWQRLAGGVDSVPDKVMVRAAGQGAKNEPVTLTAG
jgi:hypothetical protein